jgi:3-isopropylmalate dehydrogenase
MLLDHLGQAAPAARLEAAVAADLAERGTTRRSTQEVGAAIVHRLEITEPPTEVSAKG